MQWRQIFSAGRFGFFKKWTKKMSIFNFPKKVLEKKRDFSPLHYVRPSFFTFSEIPQKPLHHVVYRYLNRFKINIKIELKEIIYYDEQILLIL